MPTTTDICVVGGGPAGCVLGARLAQFGFEVWLIERATFPRRHLGESLSPGVRPLLASIGAGPALESAGFRPARTVQVHWDNDGVREDLDGQGMLVDRGRFDRLLLEHARGCGVRVLQPASVPALDHCGDTWRISLRADGTSTELTARFLADASGRSGVLGRRRRRTGPETLALYAYWAGAGLPDHPRIEAGAAEWFWGVPLPDGVYNTLVFLDPRNLRARTGRLADRFEALLATSSLFPPAANARRIGPVQAADATPYLDEACVNATSIKVGDAALALDPISSSGVQKAIQTALAGSVVVNTLLRRPEAQTPACQFYRDRLGEASSRHRAWAQGHYAQVAVSRMARFWQERAGATAAPDPVPLEPNISVPLDAPLHLSPGIEIAELPCVVDQFIEARPAVRHPSLDGPVAYVGEVELAPLLGRVRDRMTPRDLARAWMPRVPPQRGLAIAQWLVSRGLLVTAVGAAGRARGGGP